MINESNSDLTFLSLIFKLSILTEIALSFSLLSEVLADLASLCSALASLRSLLAGVPRVSLFLSFC